MKTRKYVLIHNESDKKIEFDYDFLGNLTEIKFCGERWNEKETKYALLNLVPITESAALYATERTDLKITYRKVQDDLTFKAFWNCYGKKVGKMLKAQRLWESITDAERVEIFIFLEKYNKKYIGKEEFKPYPETFLRNKMWLVEKI